MAKHHIAKPVESQILRCACGWATRLAVRFGFWSGWDEMLDRYNEHRRTAYLKRFPREDDDRGE